MRRVFAALILRGGGRSARHRGATRARTRIRIATFNASLNRASQGALLESMRTPDDPQVRAVAEIIQRVRPDILLLQEFDFDADGAALRAFQSNYLARSQNGARADRVRVFLLRGIEYGRAVGFRSRQ